MQQLPGPTDRVVVVGAGLAGLAAALHLRGAGRSVTIVEAGGTPGGCAGRAVVGAYTFDTGPTVITMPEVVDAALGAVGERLRDRVTLQPVDPVYRAVFADGSRLDVSTDVDRTAAAIGALAGDREAAGYRRLVRRLGAVFRVERDTFIDRNVDGAGDLLGPDLARLVALGGLRSMHGLVGHYLHDDRVRRVFTFQSLYAGVSPWAARAIYAVIPYLDTVAGAVYPAGGVHELPLAMAAAAADAGVMIRYGIPVERVLVAGGRAGGVRLAGGEVLTADVVVLALDAPRAYAGLLGRPMRRHPRTSPSCVLLQLGRNVAGAGAHHTISFGAAWRSTFAELTRHGRLMRDPSLLVTAPPEGAPEGGSTTYVLAPAPNLATARIDWPALAPRYADELCLTLAARGIADLRGGIDVRRLVTPPDWVAAGHTDGTPFAAAHTVAQTGPFRLANRVPGLDNVVLAGAWTTPGVGVPMAVISGRLAAERITG